MRLIAFLLLIQAWAFSAQVEDKVVFCGVCKNVEKALPKMVKAIEKAGNQFQDYRVLIFENNSSDKTVSLLRKWERANYRVSAQCETFSDEQLQDLAKCHTWDGKPFRTEIIAYARNTLLEKVLSPEFESYKYVVVTDMDFEKPWNPKELIKSIHQKVEWDAICANGITYKGFMFDLYAFRHQHEPLGPEILGKKWWIRSQKTINLDKNQGLFPVYSAFGGLAIYKREAIKGSFYSGTVTKELESFVQGLLQDTENPIITDYLNSEILDELTYYTSTGPDAIRWVQNSGGYGVPACCEHVTFHASMALKGHGKLFINPKLIVEYQGR